MKNRAYVLVAAVLLFPGLGAGQDQNDGLAYVYATYFNCDPTAEARADEIITRNFKPHYDLAVEQGNLQSWSWLAHFIGGSWRRALVLTADNMSDLLDSSGALGEIIEEATPEAGRAFTEVCPTHVDYIWESSSDLRSGRLGEERGAAGFSSYFTCDTAREERADELVAEVFAPIYSKYAGPDGLVSWVWLKHNVGGERRRLLAMTGSDHKALMEVRQAIIDDIGTRRLERARRDFSEICHTHEDYMWDIVVETP
ncbi:MAG: hypothetical protein HKN35_05655 [Woeseia sp.]|nr:hypothetical protein [Woeseia sp.]MBT8095675.1 hypothetical protein [Woeseia sp.]NNE60354.1 hypothetical protein [Woeseia sp.]NNL54659.1 hypothetical protein [Woeseia sp.]